MLNAKGCAVSVSVSLGLLMGLVAALRGHYDSQKWVRAKLTAAASAVLSAHRGQTAFHTNAIPEKLIVVAHHAEDLTWLALRSGDLPIRVYQDVANLTKHRLHCPPGEQVGWPADCPDYAFETFGFEASAYIQFIVDNYESRTLPEWTLFIHAHEEGVHRGKNEPLLHKLKWGSKPWANLQYHGYTDWACGDRTPHNLGVRPCSVLALAISLQDPNKARDAAYNEPPWWANIAVDGVTPIIIKYWPAIFQEEFGDMPEWIVVPASGAEFMVSRERILRRSLKFWQNALRVLHAAPSSEEAKNIAIGFEQMWHGIFGEPWASWAVSKCEMYECSEEEKADPLLVAPALPDPYMLPHVWKERQAAANQLGGR